MSAPTTNELGGCNVIPEVATAGSDGVTVTTIPVDDDDGWLNTLRLYARVDDVDGYGVVVDGREVGNVGTGSGSLAGVVGGSPKLNVDGSKPKRLSASMNGLVDCDE